jgi:2-polyprenyl-3-methyl-5-hydroxy-6-metoxy-1,4-benzoquinol methylase
MNCRFCGSQWLQVHYRDCEDYFFETSLITTYYRCNECNVLQSFPTTDLLNAAYENYYTTAVPEVNNVARRLKFHRFIFKLLPDWLHSVSRNRPFLSAHRVIKKSKTAINALDFGYGSGAKSIYLKLLGFRVTAVDAFPQNEAMLEKNGITVRRNLDGITDRYHYILMDNVIEHVATPVDTVNRAISLLEPGGVLVVIFPNAKSPFHTYFGKRWRGLESPRHLSVIDESVIRNSFPSADFRITKNFKSDLYNFKVHRKIHGLSLGGAVRIAYMILTQREPSEIIAEFRCHE